ncbi:hypothetical protein C8Q73DRAFT_665004 [Cubamyces lactineus]|nr:hypothetical protein C8Q73DRAFT_665004 [Cubamyces lactineus]
MFDDPLVFICLITVYTIILAVIFTAVSMKFGAQGAAPRRMQRAATLQRQAPPQFPRDRQMSEQLEAVNQGLAPPRGQPDHSATGVARAQEYPIPRAPSRRPRPQPSNDAGDAEAGTSVAVKAEDQAHAAAPSRLPLPPVKVESRDLPLPVKAESRDLPVPVKAESRDLPLPVKAEPRAHSAPVKVEPLSAVEPRVAGSVSQAGRINAGGSRSSTVATPVRGAGGSQASSPYRKRTREVSKVSKKQGHGGDKARPLGPVLATWFETENIGEALIDRPPDLTGEPGLVVEIGDLYYHRTSTQYQFWLWSIGPQGEPFWMPVHYGYIREDGRRLIVTTANRWPSWVKAH